MAYVKMKYFTFNLHIRIYFRRSYIFYVFVTKEKFFKVAKSKVNIGTYTEIIQDLNMLDIFNKTGNNITKPLL